MRITRLTSIMSALLVMVLHGIPGAKEVGIPSIHGVEIGVTQVEVEHQCGKPDSVERSEKAPWGRWSYRWGSVFFDQAGTVDEIRGLPLYLSGKPQPVVSTGMTMAEVDASFSGKKRRHIAGDIEYRIGRQAVQVGYDDNQKVQICRIIRSY